MSRLEKYLTKYEGSKKSHAAIAYLAALDHIESVAPDIAKTIVNELKSQRSHLKLIASENFSSLAVQLAMGNLLTDKYAEGYVNHRFYAGCENVDLVEDAAASELKKIFNAECAYVQPHSGADANLVAFWSILVHRLQGKALEKLQKKSIDEMTSEERTIFEEQLQNDISFNESFTLYKETTQFLEYKFSSEKAAFEQNITSIAKEHFASKKETKVIAPISRHNFVVGRELEVHLQILAFSI